MAITAKSRARMAFPDARRIAGTDRWRIRRGVGRLVLTSCCLTLSILALAAPAEAAPGDLDPSFSGDGVQTTDFAGQFDGVRSVAVQPDGKIVVAGRTGNAPDFALARYNADGSPDSSFSGDGKQTTDFGGFDEAFGMALQADGKIVVVGDSDAGAGPIGTDIDFAVARYNSDGSLDTSFSGDGKLLTDVGGDDDAKAVAVQPDGKIVVVGSKDVGFSTTIDWALARYNPDGSLDASFSADGLQTTDFGGLDGAAGVALQSDAKIVVDGSAANDFGLARYNADGSLDTSFSGDGKLLTDFGGIDFANGIAIQPDGKIVAAGGSRMGVSSQFALARYSTDGSLDTSFSGDGMQTTNFAGDIDVASGVVVDSSGKIVAAGGLEDSTGGEGPPFDFALARYNADGSLDASFSGDGMQTTDLGGFETARGGLALQPDGNVVVAGSNDDFMVARYLASGTTDVTPPETTITSGPPDGSSTSASTATFEFASNEPSSTFVCRIDGDSSAPCTSPYTTPSLAAGQHTFSVAATDAASNSDATPATRTFTVLAPVPPPPPPVAPPPAPVLPPATPPVDTTPPAIKLTAATQKLGRSIVVLVSCPGEACAAKLSGSILVPRVGARKAKTYKLKAIATKIAKGQKVTIKLTVPATARVAIRRALRAHKQVSAKVKLSATDTAGNRKTVDRQVRLKQ